MVLGGAQEVENFVQLFSREMFHIQLVKLDIGYFLKDHFLDVINVVLIS